MADNPTITSVQDAFKNAAEAAAREKQAAPTNGNKPDEGKPLPPADNGKPPADKPADQPPADKPDKPASIDLRAHIREKYGVDIDEEELGKRLKTNGEQPKPSGSEKKARKQPAKEDITDDDVSKFFEDNKKTDVYSSHLTNKKKEDAALVKESHHAYLKQEFPDMDDDEMDELFNERYFIPSDESDKSFSEEEKKLGQKLIKQEAERVRNATGYQVEAVRDILYNQAKANYEMDVYREAVDDFLTTQTNKLVMPLGKSNLIDLGDYPIELEEQTVNVVKDIMRTPMNIMNRFKASPDDEGLDLQKFYNFLIKAELFDNAIKSTAVDYYSKGVEAVENKLNNNPDLSNGNKGADKKLSQKEEQDKAKEYNQKQVAENLGRGRKR